MSQSVNGVGILLTLVHKQVVNIFSRAAGEVLTARARSASETLTHFNARQRVLSCLHGKFGIRGGYAPHQ